MGSGCVAGYHPADIFDLIIIFTMNVLITLPSHLIDAIIRGEKLYEMRKSIPKMMHIGEDGFFVVEKGTDKIRLWCRVDSFCETYVDSYSVTWFEQRLCVSGEYIEKYAKGQKVYLWKIGKVKQLEGLTKGDLFVNVNPQSFVYCILSYGESF